jgi:poly-gamma-glutamate synthesis protein (capsule biosynthesis protein)
VAAADMNAIAVTVRKTRQRGDVDAIVVSHHGGAEYLDIPLPVTRKIARAAIDAGADAFLGHHPHVIHGVEMRRGRPIFYSLGNYVMKMSGEHPEVELGMLARLKLRRGAPPVAEVCPVRAEGLEAVPLAADPRRAETEAAFTERLRQVSARTRPGAVLGSFGADGCAPLSAEPANAR